MDPSSNQKRHDPDFYGACPTFIDVSWRKKTAFFWVSLKTIEIPSGFFWTDDVSTTLLLDCNYNLFQMWDIYHY